MLAHSSQVREQGPADVSDAGSSSLSELGDMPDDQQELDPGFDMGVIDQRDDVTEASTERVDPSPLKQRDVFNRDPIGLEQLADAAAVDQLQEAEAMEDDDIQEDDDPMFESIEGPTEAYDQPRRDMEDTSRLPSPGKRKRSSSLSELEDDFLDEQVPPSRKRSASARDFDPELMLHKRTTGASVEAIEEEAIRVEVDPPESDEDAAAEAPSDELEEPQTRLAPPKDEEEAVEEVGVDDQMLPPEEVERPEEAGAENDDNVRPAGDVGEAEAAARNEDELARKRAAMDDLKPIENLFAIFRDKLFDERLDELSAQIDDLRQPNPTNSEFLAKKQAVDLRRDQKIQYEDTVFRYKAGALEREAIADRSIMHSQFAQEIREIRETYLDKMNAYSSQLQRERRAWKAKTDHYIYRFNPKRTQQIAYQRAYNKEVSLLSGIARYQGFPAAPPLESARNTDIEEDLKRIKVSRIHSRQHGIDRQANEVQSQSRPQPLSYAAQIAHDEMAGEANFLEKNPWARPMPMATLAGPSDPRMSRPPVPEQVMPTPRPLARNGILPNQTPVQAGPVEEATAPGKHAETATPTLTKVESRETDLAPNGAATEQSVDKPLSNSVVPVPALETDNSPTQEVQPVPQNGDVSQTQANLPSILENGGPSKMHNEVPVERPVAESKSFVAAADECKPENAQPRSAHLHLPGPDRDHTTNFSPPPRVPQSVG